MKNIRPLVMLLIALVLGITAAAYAANWIQKSNTLSTTAVLVAKRDLQMGTRLQPDMLETIQWPKSAPIQDPVTTLEQAVDRVIHMPLLRGEPILLSKLAGVGEKGGLSSVLSEGQRAVTVKVNEIMGVAGFALPGNYVDVMVNVPDGPNQSVSKILMERIQVLAVAQDVASSENKPRVVNAVTLQVSPQQAEQIDLARSVGTLSLVLRSQSDTASVSTAGARKLDLVQSGPNRTGPDTAQPPVHPARMARPARPKATPPASDNTAPDTPSDTAHAGHGTEVIRGLSMSRE